MNREENPLDLEAITFDFWNTLAVDSQPARVRELAAEKMTTGIRELGLKISREDMFKAFSECRQICYSYQEDKEIDFTPKEQLDWILEHFGVNTTLPMWNRLFLYYTTSLFDIPPFFAEGLEGILKELKAKYRLAVICNTGRTPGWVIRKILKDNDLEQHFDVLVFSNEMGIAKPNPLIFEITSRLLETHPSRIIHVGDDLRTDVGGALRAGFKTGWYNPKGIKKEVDCDFLLNNLSDLVKIQ
jgi:FMN phosphatase YigB (HAD superfamily)